MSADFKVICLESEAFYQLVRQVVDRMTLEKEEDDKWILQEEAMKLLGIKSKSTLQRYRDDRSIVYSKMGKIILYDKDSILHFIEENAKDPI